MSLREVYQHILDACARSALVTGVELLLLDDPVLKLRVHVGPLAFVDIFWNTETRKTSFARIKDGARIFGADNTRGWHLHPFHAPENHHPCDAMPFENFLQQVEAHKSHWERS